MSNEPTSLKEYRKTPNAQFAGCNKNDIQDALLKEQGCLCAYCMARISKELNQFFKPKIEIEHIESQEFHPDLQLDYRNMIGVCNGNAGKPERLQHCDKSKRNKDLKRLNPTKIDCCENLITYSKDGEIKPINENKDVEDDLKLLNLNQENLVKYRKQALDKAIIDMQKEKPHQDWTTHFIEKHIDKWFSMKNGQYLEYCNIVLWDLKRRLQKLQK